ncbi:MAG: hypothetical protein PHP59_02510 [Methanofollis sp.]|nr:hypothetical protein [Methanofollis sp.]MDD4254230.1 hypothetical protein [Methanofollis sp.]
MPLIFGVAWWAYNAGEDDESDGAGNDSPAADDTAQVDESEEDR